MTTITGHELARMLTAVRPHAHLGGGFPELHGVRLETNGAQLHAVATDRYTLGAASHIITLDVPFPLAVTIPLHAVDHLIDILDYEWDTDVAITTDGDAVTFIAGDVVFTTAAAAADFPNWISLFEDALKGDPGVEDNEVAFKPDQLARFAAVDTAQPMQMFVNRARGTALVRRGEEFLGLIRTIRPAADGMPSAQEAARLLLGAWEVAS